MFLLIQNKGDIEEEEMYHTFNMGVGMVLIVRRRLAKSVLAKLAEYNLKSWIIGEVIKGNKEVVVA
jgi:phosphoribosylformylglycinamidine cyclo-ligase